jgi:hypothetical protein
VPERHESGHQAGGKDKRNKAPRAQTDAAGRRIELLIGGFERMTVTEDEKSAILV